MIVIVVVNYLYGVLGIRARDRRMVGTDKSTELRRPLVTLFVHETLSSCKNYFVKSFHSPLLLRLSQIPFFQAGQIVQTPMSVPRAQLPVFGVSVEAGLQMFLLLQH